MANNNLDCRRVSAIPQQFHGTNGIFEETSEKILIKDWGAKNDLTWIS